MQMKLAGALDTCPSEMWTSNGRTIVFSGDATPGRSAGQVTEWPSHFEAAILQTGW